MSKADCDIRISTPGNESPRVVTGQAIYIRFHGTTGRYAGDYPESQLRGWADWLKTQAPNARAIYVYFNNDSQAHAVKNAKTLRMLVSTHY